MPVVKSDQAPPRPLPGWPPPLEGVQLDVDASATATLPSVDDVIPDSIAHPAPAPSPPADEEPASTDLLTAS